MEQNVQMIKEFSQPSPKEAHFKNKSWIAKADFEKKQNVKKPTLKRSKMLRWFTWQEYYMINRSRT